MFCPHKKIKGNLGFNSEVSAADQMIIKCVISSSKKINHVTGISRQAQG